MALLILVVGALQGRRSQILLRRGFQDVVGNIAGLCQGAVAVIHRLGQDHRHQTIRIGHLLGVAGLQRGHGRQEMTAIVHEPKDIGDIATRDLIEQRRL